MVLSACASDETAADSDSDRSTRQRPNILFVLADDLGINDVGAFRRLGEGAGAGIGGTEAPSTLPRTPRLDELARGGLRFTRFYSHASCAAARAGFLTGQYPEALGFRPAGPGLDPELTILPERLQRSGYRTAHVGKWHLGFSDRAAWPLQQGYEHFFGFLSQFQLQVPAGDSGFRHPGYENPWLQRDNGSRERMAGHLSDLLLDEARRQIGELSAGEAPWFLSFWPFAPHAPAQPTPEMAEHFDDSPAGRHAAMVATLDQQIDALMRALQEHGVATNTVLIFAGDNGGSERFFPSNAPYSGGKGLLREGGTRVPMFLYGPSIAPGERDDVASYLDVAPTLEAFAGAQPRGADARPGRNLVDEGPQSQALFWASGVPPVRSSAALSKDGRFRWVADFLAPDGVLLSTEPPAAEDVSASHRALRHALEQAYALWDRKTRAVPVQRISEGPRGQGQLRGADFRRSPGFGSHTLAVCLRAPAGTAQGVIAAQDGVFELALDDGVLRLHMPGLEGEAALTTPASGLLVLTSHTEYAFAFPDLRGAQAAVYLEGERVLNLESAVLPPPPSHHQAPTELGRDASGGRSFTGTIGRSRIWSDRPVDAALGRSSLEAWKEWSDGFTCGGPASTDR